jgi:uncharacterized protein
MEEKKTPDQTQQSQVPLDAKLENKDQEVRTYLKAMPLRDLSDLDLIKAEVIDGNILIIKITPLANKSMVDVSQAVNELYSFTQEIGGDIARLGEERIVICPPTIRIWREKTPVKKEPIPTAA